MNKIISLGLPDNNTSFVKNDSVTSNKLLENYIAYDKKGNKIIGTMSGDGLKVCAINATGGGSIKIFYYTVIDGTITPTFQEATSMPSTITLSNVLIYAPLCIACDFPTSGLVISPTDAGIVLESDSSSMYSFVINNEDMDKQTVTITI